jgi:hypothetical protein
MIPAFSPTSFTLATKRLRHSYGIMLLDSISVSSASSNTILIDFRDYLKLQTGRLLADPVHPPSLYVPQRMEFEIGAYRDFTRDAFGTVAGWLRETDPRFILILGEFGTGKTFLLYELARRLGADASVTPVLVELLALEKAGSINQLLAGPFARHRFDRIELDRLRYMIREGSVTLLFDGFDELALRVAVQSTKHVSTESQPPCYSPRSISSRTSPPGRGAMSDSYNKGQHIPPTYETVH